MKKIYMMLIILAIFIIMIGIYNVIDLNNNYKVVVNNFKKSNYQCNLMFYNDLKNDDNQGVIIYNYKDNTEEYFADVVYRYKDYNDNIQYILDDDNYIRSIIDDNSIHNRIINLLSSYKTVNKKGNKYQVLVNKNDLSRFIRSFNDIISYSKNDKYRVEVVVKNKKISEISVFSSEKKYLKFVFSSINNVKDIKLPTKKDV